MSVLREAAHARHCMVSAACWWWFPPVHMVSQVVHARIVDGFYDALEGPSAPPPFLIDDESSAKDRNLMIIALILLLALSMQRTRIMMSGEDDLRFRLLASVVLEKSKQAKREIEELTKEIEEYMDQLRGKNHVA